MDFQEFILSRRSIRKYTEKKIEKEDILKMLEAAMAAPSAVAKDPWHFIVVTQKETREKIAEILPYGKMLNQAPLAVVVCGDRDKAYLGETGEQGYMVQDCSAAVENLMLSAWGLGIGSVWLGVYPQKVRMDGLSELLQLSGNRLPLAVISLGYPAETQASRTRYKEQNVSWIE